MANVVIDIAAEYTGNKAFKKAQTATSQLEKSVDKLGKKLAGLFAASKIYAFGKASVKAFAEDEKAARSLALALANTGNAFAAIEVEKFIADLQRATGVLDDNLRPAFRTLLTATGDVKKSQDGLALALDIAAGTGKDLSAVSMALAKAYGGQTTALSRLGAGLDKATLKAGDMDVILAKLTEKFKGQALAAAEGYSGALAKLTVASENAKEIIGKDLLDSMQMIAGKEGIGGAALAMENFATQIGNAIYGIGVLTTKIQSLPGAGFFGSFLKAASQVSGIGLLSKYGASQKAANAGTPAQSPGQRKAIDKANADALRLQKSKNDLAKIDNANTTRKLALTADQQALEELKKNFDLDRIQINAALNENIDKETELRLKSLLAIHDNDAALAGKIKAELEATSAINTLSGAASAAAALLYAMGNPMDAARSAIGAVEVASNYAFGNPMDAARTLAAATSGESTSIPSAADIPSLLDRGANRIYSSTQGVSIQINPAVAGLIDVIQNQSASGISPTVDRVNSSYIA